MIGEPDTAPLFRILTHQVRPVGRIGTMRPLQRRSSHS
jgi:hypothetical protein